MKMIKKNSLAIIVISIFSLQFCKKKDDSPAVCDISHTYESTVASIISNNCSSGSCHGISANNPKFSTYAELKPYLDNGRFKELVVEKQTMPRGSSLSSSDLNAIKCWVEAGYPEK